jgi:hypothetical protein
MEPSLKAGWKVRIEADTTALQPGEVVLIRGRSDWLLHRVVHLCRIGSTAVVYHRGDHGLGVGVADRASVCGRAAEVVEPPGETLPSLEDLSGAFRRQLKRAQRRCRAHAWARGWAHRLGLTDSRAVRAAGRWLQRRLL